MPEKFTDGLLPYWAKTDGEDSDVVISSRVRLARNIKGFPFPHKANEQQLVYIIQAVMEAIGRESPVGGLQPLKIDELTPNQRMVLVEKHLCSPQFVERPKYRVLITNEEQSVSLMVNEEDHLRIQAMTPGFSLGNALSMADKIDDFLEEKLEFCFDECCGYLTSCPTNVGTGIRASVMLHLPGLTMIDQIKQVFSALTHVGINIRGLYGEGTESLGNIYQISNQVTLGHSEEDLISNIKSVCRQVIEQERAVREALMRDSKLQLEDRVCRSYGILSQARIMSTQEALKLLSDVKLGVELGIISEVSQAHVKELLFLTRTSLLQSIYGKEMTPAERDFHRAEIIREELKQI